MTIVPILWYRPNRNKEYFIKIRITDRKKVKYVNLNLTIPKKYWKKSKVSNQHPDAKRLNEIIENSIRNLKSQIEQNHHISAVESTSAKNRGLAGNIVRTIPERSIGQLLQSYIEEFTSNGKIGSSKKHKVVLNHLIKANLETINVEEFNLNHVNLFRNHLIESGVQPQGRHTYEKVIKKIFNRAIEIGLRTTLHPYTGIRTKVPKPKPPRNLSKKDIHMLEESLIFGFGKSDMYYTAISMFLFSTFSYGMRFGDVVTLKWSDIKDLKIAYNMRKTQTNIVIKITPKHANLIKYFLPHNLYPKLFNDNKDLYPKYKRLNLINDNPIIEYEHNYYKWKIIFNNRLKNLSDDKRNWSYIKQNPLLSESEVISFKSTIEKRDKELMRLVKIQSITSDNYIFPLLSGTAKGLSKEYNEISSKNTIINNQLKVIAKRMDLSPFSFHASRHSFANNIRDVEPDILKISRMLGHHSLSQTQDYLKRFESAEGHTSNDKFIGLHDDFFLS